MQKNFEKKFELRSIIIQTKNQALKLGFFICTLLKRQLEPDYHRIEAVARIKARF